MPDPAGHPRRTYFGVQALHAVAALFVVGYHATLVPAEARASWPSASGPTARAGWTSSSSSAAS